MHRRSKVVQEARYGQFHGARGAARCRLGLEHIDSQACLGQYYGRCQPVWIRTNNACLAAHRESPTNLLVFAVLLIFECATMSYSFGSIVCRSTTLMFPSDTRSSVG